MVDIHCHILPSLDDGAKREQVSLEMARMAAADGITHVVATPHSNYRFRFDPEVNRRKRDDLQEAVGASPALLLGCDFHLSFENLETLRRDPYRFTINGRRYLLVEFADNGIPPGIDQIFFDILSRQVVPIITHPERNPLLSRHPEHIRRWVDAGCFVQVTAASVCGRFGKEAERSARHLLEHQLVHFLATDAHNTSSRPPLLSDARRVVSSAYGEETGGALCEDNPRAAIEDRPLPWQPEPRPFAARRWYAFWR